MNEVMKPERAAIEVGPGEAITRLHYRADLGAKATVVPVRGGDHSFKVPKKGPVTQDEVMTTIEDAVVHFICEP